MRTTTGIPRCLIGLVLTITAGATSNLAHGEPADEAGPPAALERQASVGATTTFDEMVAYHRAHPDVVVVPAPFMESPGPQTVDSAGRVVAVDRPPVQVGDQRVPRDAVPPAGAAALAPPLITSFQGVIDNGTVIPPDTMGAVGPNHIVEFLNSGFTIYNRAGGVIAAQVSLQAFWSSLGTAVGQPANDPFDPKILYDQYSSRWVVTADGNARNRSGGGTTWMLVGISQTSDPTMAWNLYGILGNPAAGPHAVDWPDYPGLGVDPNNVIVTNNMFTIGTFCSGSGAACVTAATCPAGQACINLFVHADVWVINKANMIAGPAALVLGVDYALFHDPGATGGFTFQPCHTFGQTAATAVNYLVDQGWLIGAQRWLRVKSITGTGAAATLNTFGGNDWLQVNGYNFCQDNAPQPNCSVRINTNDTRMLDAVVRNGKIFATQSVGGGAPVHAACGAVLPFSKSEVAWYEINPAAPGVFPGGVPNQQGRVVHPTIHYYFPSIAANRNECVALGFSGSDDLDGTGTFASGFYTLRDSTDPAGTMQPVSLLKAGVDAYWKQTTGTRNRWGDYSATVVDPLDDFTFWTVQEYAEIRFGGGGACTLDSGKWGTWWGSFQCNPVCGDTICTPPENQCTCPADCGAPPPTEVGLCADAIDNDCDGCTDAADSDCGGTETSCIDGLDNDCDGLIDAADTADCGGPPVCGDGICVPPETSCNCPADCLPPGGTELNLFFNCADGVDNDCDGCVDGADSGCGAGEFGLCLDGIDNDCDGAVDCADGDCALDPVCNVSCGDGVCVPAETACTCPPDCGAVPPPFEISCADAIDNDCDGLTDCFDTVDCLGNPACVGACGDSFCGVPIETPCNCPLDCGAAPTIELACADGVDNDCDFCTDAGDSDCGGTEVVCGDGIDNDCDRCVDGNDSDCGAAETLCGDGVDNDCDGLTDLADPDCAAPGCGDGICLPPETACNCSQDCGPIPPSEAGSCANGLDDDCDAATDCFDSDCSLDPFCFGFGVCGDALCIAPENQCICPADCGAPPANETGVVACSDGLDNDCDGCIDTVDVDCPGGFESSCIDGIDNNCDGLVDCVDPTCINQPVCTGCPDGVCLPSEICTCVLDCGPPPPSEAPPFGSCGDGLDNDCDGCIDAADANCGGTEVGLCTDGIDNDCDGNADCADPDCATDPACVGVCGDGACGPAENQCNCPVDCGFPPPNEQSCNDGIDNDCDGCTDGADSDCGGAETGFCADGIDNDCDGAADCADGFGNGDCAGDPACCGDGNCDLVELQQCSCAADCGPPTETGGLACSDGFDNDCDGCADAVDSGCGGTEAGMCTDGNDNDCDGCTDSADVDCGGTETSCGDGADNDCDGLIDCADPDCCGNAACCGDGVCCPLENQCNCPADCGAPPATEAGLCSDGIDNDCDGPIDCADPDCSGNPPCCLLANPPLPEAKITPKNRFVSLVPTNAGIQTALQVTLRALPGAYGVWSGQQLWVRNPRGVTELSGSAGAGPPPTFTVANLQCSPDCRDWGAIGLIDVFSETIVPGAVLEVRAVDCACDMTNPANFSAPLTISTSVHGDIVGSFDTVNRVWRQPDGIVTILADAISAIDKFAGRTTAPRKARVDLEPGCLDLVINISDVVLILDAFRGRPYPFAPVNPALPACQGVCP